MQKLQYRFVDEESNIIKVSDSFQNSMLICKRARFVRCKINWNHLSLTWDAKGQDLLHNGATRTNESCEGSH
jgi:hypothetical protein